MDTDAIINEVKALIQNFAGAHDWAHVERVLNNAVHIGKTEGANLEIVKLAAILHDIARQKEDILGEGGPLCHAAEGAKMAAEILKRHNYSEKTITAVADCIKTHRFRKENAPKTIEAKVLYDADKLDAIGAIGVARAFYCGGQFKQKLYSDFSASPKYTGGVTNHNEHTPVIEFQMKLSKLKDKMLTQEGKRLAQERHNFMGQFYTKLEQEVNGES